MTYNSALQDRAGQSAQAKQKALEQFKSRPPVDEKLAAERKAAAQRREEAKAEKAADEEGRSRSESSGRCGQGRCLRSPDRGRGEGCA